MKPFALMLLGSCLLLPAALFAGPAEDYGRFFGEEEKKVLATPTKDDDIAFARKLLEGAKTITDAPKSADFLCRKCIEIAMETPGGGQTALEGVRLLAKIDPEEESLRELNLKALRKAYEDGTRKQQEPLAYRYIRALLKDGDLLCRKADTAKEAEEAYRTALRVALKHRINCLDEIRGKIKLAQAIHERAQRQKELTGKLKADPSNAKLRLEVILFTLTELDRPDRAKALLDSSVDKELAGNIKLAATPLKKLTKQQVLQLGDWYYKELGESGNEVARGRMLARAQTLYQRFLELHEDRDLLGFRVKASLKRVEDLLREIGPADPTRCAGCNDTGTMDCPHCLLHGKPTGKAKCATCEGDGWVTCSRCGGSYATKCSTCGGDGKIFSHTRKVGPFVKKVYRSCRSCGGTGYIHTDQRGSMPRTMNGKCPNCSNRSRSLRGKEPCPKCEGKGLSGTCSKCKGRKRVPCTHCDSAEEK